MARGRKSFMPRTASAVTRQFFAILDAQGISQTEMAERASVHLNTLHHWRSGKSGAGVLNMEAALQTLGLELCIRPISEEPIEGLPK